MPSSTVRAVTDGSNRCSAAPSVFATAPLLPVFSGSTITPITVCGRISGTPSRSRTGAISGGWARTTMLRGLVHVEVVDVDGLRLERATDLAQHVLRGVGRVGHRGRLRDVARGEVVQERRQRALGVVPGTPGHAPRGQQHRGEDATTSTST